MSKGSETKTRIPEALRPLAKKGVSTGIGALGDLERLLSAPVSDLIAGFTPEQEYGQNLTLARALDPNGPYATSRNVMTDAANGVDLSSFIDQGALDTLGSRSEIPSGVLDRLNSGDVDYGSRLRDILNDDLMSQVLSPGGGIPQNALDALNRTASGEYLYGGAGFDAAVEAANRAAQSNILSTFGAAGAGGGTGALAKHAIGKSAIDSLASQYAQERTRQDAAAGLLAELGLEDRGQRADIISTFRGQDADIASSLENLGVDFQKLGLQEADILGSLFDAGENRDTTRAQTLAGLGETERANQLNAAQTLPALSSQDIQAILGVGADKQSLAQAMKNAPIDAKMRLLDAALGGAAQQVGTKSSTDNTGQAVAGTAATAAALSEAGFFTWLLGLSDPRLKENVSKIGTFGPLNIYEWDWNGLMGMEGSGVGFMADEVAEVLPEAVGERDGYMTVNYPRAIQWALLKI